MRAQIVFVSLALIAIAFAQSDCGGNCPSGACESCPCGTSSNVVGKGTFAGYLHSVDLDQNTFLCIANSESSFNANAMNQNGANMAVGVLQVDDNNGYSAKELCDPYDNAKAAAALYKECGICPWIDDSSCFNTACCAGSYCNNKCKVGGTSATTASHSTASHATASHATASHSSASTGSTGSTGTSGTTGSSTTGTTGTTAASTSAASTSGSTSGGSSTSGSTSGGGGTSGTSGALEN